MSGKEKKKRAYVELIIMRGWFYAIINDLIEGKLLANLFYYIESMFYHAVVPLVFFCS